MTASRALMVVLLLAASAAAGATADGVAVVELFTSEGCSSCPPADRVLAALVERSARKGSSIYPLAFHVDYWDRLGWRDRFADAAFSDRQREYAARLGERRVYTPQVVVNGRVSTVGSNEPAVRRAVDEALEQPAKVKLGLRVRRISPTRLAATVSVDPSPTPVLVCFAVVERGLITAVGAGENGGRELRHDNVVRGFATATPRKGTAGASLDIPGNLVSGNATVIAYAQNPDSLAILGATSAPLPAIR